MRCTLFIYAALATAAVSITNGETMGATTSARQQANASTSTLTAVPFTHVKIQDKFWAPRQETNRTVSLPHSLEMLEKSGNIKALKIAAEGAKTGHDGPLYIDSDLYKAIEAISYSLANVPDPGLEQKLDKIIGQITAAQQPDGYLNTWVQVIEPDKRWSNLRDNHELYCAGHLFEAAVAHYQATGKRTLLDVATRFADHIDSVFGGAPGKRMGYPGHEEIELALFKLWHATGEQRYYDLARFFLESRGGKFFATEHGDDPTKYNGDYWQDNVPLRDHNKMVGHAVRAAYLMSGATDYAAATTTDTALKKMLDRVWANTTGRNMYVTGGIGSSAANEGFTHDFDLPNMSAYQETCASVAMMMWNQRLGYLSGDSKYADAMERTLYNGFLSGVSLDGKKYFYVNPLASNGTHHRKEWYGCACCPPNVTRTLAQLGGYAYATSPGALWVNLYMAGSVQANLGGQKISMDVATDYPWDGQVRLKPKVTSASAFQLRLRVPGWCDGETVSVNGAAVQNPSVENGYLVLDRTWNPGDEVVLDLPMAVVRLAADPRVEANAGRLAIQRGPLVYCLEAADQASSVSVAEIAISKDAQLSPQRRPDLLGGVVTLTGEGKTAVAAGANRRQLYTKAPEEQPVNITAIPYYAWDNRTPGEMAVWIPTTAPTPEVKGLERNAAVTMSFANTNCNVNGCRDGLGVKESADYRPDGTCHWWPHKGGEEWVQYSWDAPQKASGARAFWFDDTGHGQCRLPVTWQIEYQDGEQWKPVRALGEYPVELDQWCEAHFEPVDTKALRLSVQMQPDFAAGVHEWQVFAP